MKGNKKYGRLTVNIDYDKYQQLKIKVIKEGTTIQELISKFVDRYLKED